jgi:hypothetical protein
MEVRTLKKEELDEVNGSMGPRVPENMLQTFCRTHQFITAIILIFIIFGLLAVKSCKNMPVSFPLFVCPSFSL